MPVTVSKPAFNLREALNSLRRKMGIKGAELLKANTVDEAYDVINPVAFKNLLINGDMRINQRGSASYTTDSAYTLDRWKFGRYGSDAVEGSQQSSGSSLPEFPYCFRIQNPSGVTSAYANEIHLTQVLESLNSARLRNKPVTLSFWARVASTSGISNGATGTIFFGSGTDNYADYNYFASNAIGGPGGGVSRTFQLTTEWSRYSLTAVAPATTNQVGVTIAKLNNAATAIANDYIEITGVQLEVSSAPTPFEHRPYATELALCQRYFYKNLTDASGAQRFQIDTYVTGGVYPLACLNHPVPMRTTPTKTKIGSWVGSNINAATVGFGGNELVIIIQADSNGTGRGYLFPAANEGWSASAEL